MKALDSNRSTRWHLAQECQQANQLDKKSKLVRSDLKLFILRRYQYADELFETFSKFKKITSTTKILEVGSGPHGVSFFYPIGMKIALDPLASFYRKEFAFVQERGNAILLQGVGEKLPFFSKVFDCVVSDNVIDHTSDAQEVLSEIFRVLKDDGMFFLAINLHHWVYSLFSFAFKVLFFFNIILNFPNFRTHTYFFTPSRMKRMIKNEGFKILFEDIPLQRDLSNGSSWRFDSFKPFNHVPSIFVCSKGHPY